QKNMHVPALHRSEQQSVSLPQAKVLDTHWLWHVSLQPSPSMVLPSSHVSPPVTMESPQFAEQTDGSPAQEKPGSSKQKESQPSRSPLPPSSHSSEPETTPSPQIDRVVEVVVGDVVVVDDVVLVAG